MELREEMNNNNIKLWQGATMKQMVLREEMSNNNIKLWQGATIKQILQQEVQQEHID